MCASARVGLYLVRWLRLPLAVLLTVYLVLAGACDGLQWYRAPEVLYHLGAYTEKVDIFALGCVFAEILNKRPILPGDDSYHQVRLPCPPCVPGGSGGGGQAGFSGSSALLCGCW